MLTTFNLIRLLLDFGMFVLIWVVQLIIYPGLRYFSEENLKAWHKKYMQVSVIVIIPLMLGQLILAIIQHYYIQDSYTIISLAILFALWMHTFYRFVPLHNAIKITENSSKITSKLVKNNWWRTIF